MIILKLKKLYLSALSIVIVVLVLLVFISISTYRNLDRAERNTLAFLHRQGLDLVHMLSAAAETVDGNALDTLFAQTAAGDIAYVYLVDSRGSVTRHSDPERIGTPTPVDVDKEATVHIRALPGGIRIYELSTIFSGRTRIVLGLKMSAFEEARQADFHHAIIMAAIVIALGSGALFFFFVIHNYYSVEKTLEKTQEKVRRAEKLAAIGKLAAGVAHEIRNPLSSIRGFAQFLSHTLKDRPEEKEYADIMVREVDRINRVVTDLLTFARPMAPERTRVNLPELVDHTLRLVTADARDRTIVMTRHMVGEIADLWLAPHQITQALLNLLLNALQATPDNGHIEVGARVFFPEGLLHLWVEDDGRGIPTEHLDTILDPFFTTREKGTGLGLAIVQKIAHAHHGDILIESPAPGKMAGSRITLHIPGVFPEKGKDGP